MTNSTQDLHFSTNFQRSVNPAFRDSVQDFDPFSGGRYLRAFDAIEDIDQCSHHILVYLGSRMPYDQGTFVGIQVWPSIATISQCTKMDSSTVRRKVHRLAEMGYITAKRNKRMNNAGKWEQGSNTYALTEKAFLQYAIAVQQKTLANAEVSLPEREALEQKILLLKARLGAFERGEELIDLTASNTTGTTEQLATTQQALKESRYSLSASTSLADGREVDNPLAESDQVQDLQSTVVRRQPATPSLRTSGHAAPALTVCPPPALGKPATSTESDIGGVPSLCAIASPLQTARTPVANASPTTGQGPGGAVSAAGAALAVRETNSPLKSPMNSPAKSSSRLQVRTYDALERQLIVEEEVDVGRFNNVIADLSRQYATYFGTNPSKGDLDRFCGHFLDLCPNTLGADEQLMDKVYEDMKWVYDRPHLHRSVRSINFVWYMAKMREKDEAYARRISYFISSMIREGKSVEEALQSCAKAMNLNVPRFVEWAKAHLSLQV